ncbi:MAG: Uma2 family endonuclease [Hyphomicrobiaceae bacterium]
MSTAIRSPDQLTVEAYLAGENDGQLRHEFVDGRVFAMAGASERKNGVKLNIAGALNASVDEPCRVFDGDMKLRVDQGPDVRFYYPDVFVSCSTENDDAYVRRDAALIIEVLSPSTERTDRFEKVQAYISLPMLSEYALVEQDVPRVEIHRRRTGWSREVFGPGSSVTFESISQTMTVDQIYRRIRF